MAGQKIRFQRLREAIAKPLLQEKDDRIAGTRKDLVQARRDLDAMDRELREAQRLIHTDMLTKLEDTIKFDEAIERAIRLFRRGGRMTAVLFIDINDFKGINDKYGHVIGDDVLRFIADSLLTHTRPEDRVFRIGGDEFGVTLSDATESGTRTFIRNLSDMLNYGARSVSLGSEIRIPVSISVGVAYVTGSSKPNELRHKADCDMYERKQEAKRSVWER